MAQRNEGPEGGRDGRGAKNLRQTRGGGLLTEMGGGAPFPAPDGTKEQQWQFEPRTPGCPPGLGQGCGGLLQEDRRPA